MNVLFIFEVLVKKKKKPIPTIYLPRNTFSYAPKPAPRIQTLKSVSNKIQRPRFWLQL